MLVQEEYICKNGVRQIHTYSDSDKPIRQIETGIIYSEAYDNIPLKYTYEEVEEYNETTIQPF